MRQYSTEEQEAARLKLEADTLRKWRVRGDGPPYIKIGRSVRYDPDVTDEWLAKRFRTSTSELAA